MVVKSSGHPNRQCTSWAWAITLLLSLVLLQLPVYAQSGNGQISGLVTDSSGRAVVDAAVVATNTATNIHYRTTTNSAGVYVLPQMVPGPYTIQTSKAGFAAVTQSGITLRIGDTLAMNFQIKPGTQEQTITVTGALPLLQLDQASSSSTLDNKMITELPQLSRDPLSLTAVTPSVQGQGPLADSVGTLGNAAFLIANNGTSYAVAGGQVNGSTIMVDGNLVQEAEFNAVNRSIPTPDSIGEFRVQTGVLTADHGRYSGGVISMSTKSGTSQFHGRLFDYYRTQKLDANDWMNNAQGIPLQPFHQSNYGFTLGGPLTIPHLYSGKDRTFFFFSWEGERYQSSSTVRSSVPTALNHNGDFSQTVINYQNGQPVYARIFDPFHGSTDANGNWVRPEYPNEIIPASGGTLSTQSQLFQDYLSLWPMPNHAPDANTDHANNYWSTITMRRPTDRFFLRVDHNLTNNQRFNLSLSRSRMTDNIPAPFLHAASSVTTDHDITGSLQYTWVTSPSSVLDFHLGFGIANLLSNGVSGSGSDPDPNIDTSKWPFDPMILNNPERSTVQIPPVLHIPGYTSVGGAEFDSFLNQTTNGSVAFTKIIGRHTLKAGYQEFFARFNENGGDRTGVAWVNPGGGSNQFWNNNDGMTGSPLAELMMGSSNFFQWGNWNIAPYGYDQAAYLMDDWKVNDKLTVQMGLRWDHDSPRQSRFPKGSLMYDMNAKNVLTPNSGWSWAQVQATVPGLANYPQPEWLTTGATGRVVLLDTPEYPQKNLYSTTKANYQPRLGISYALNQKTVLHGSFGIIDQGLNGLSTDWFSFYYNSNTFNQVSSVDGMHWISEFGRDHGLGTFPAQPNGTNLGWYPPVTTNAAYGFQTFGAAANLDQGGTTINHYDSPTDYTWDFSVQRQLGSNWVASADYTGIHGIHLLTDVWNWSPTNVPLSYYALGSNLQTQVPNPFYGQSQQFSAEPTVPLYQLLGNAPQYSQTSPGQASWGRSFSNFLNLQLQSRSFHGLTLMASYSIRKTLTNSSGKDPQHNSSVGQGILQDPHNLMEGYGLALYEMPQTMLFNYSYDLPFGKGRRFLNTSNTWFDRAANTAVGGWSFAGDSTWHPKGTPVLMPTVSGGVTAPGAALRWSLKPGVNYLNSNLDYGQDLAVNGAFTVANPKSVFNSAAFVRTPDYTLANTPFVFANVRNPGSFYTDATLMKKFYFSSDDQRYAEFRIEALNLLNHPVFNSLDNNPDSPTFGAVQGKSGGRTMELGLRIFF